MIKLKLILVRHGETDHNTGLRLTGWGDPDLNEKGRAQAQELAENLAAEYKIEQIYTSPLRRASQTALPLASLTGLTPIVKEDLKELNFGEMEGMTIPEIKEQMPDVFTAWRSNDPLFEWPGGENRQVFHSRVDKATWEIIQAEIGVREVVAIIGHGAALAGFVTEIVTGSPFLWREWLLDNGQHYIIEVEFPAGSARERKEVKFSLSYVGNQLDLASENKLKEEG